MRFNKNRGLFILSKSVLWLSLGVFTKSTLIEESPRVTSKTFLSKICKKVTNKTLEVT